MALQLDEAAVAEILMAVVGMANRAQRLEARLAEVERFILSQQQKEAPAEDGGEEVADAD